MSVWSSGERRRADHGRGERVRLRRGRHRVRRLGRGTIVLLVVLGVLIVGTTGTAFAAYRYDRSHAGRILPGITIDGVAVGDMTRAQAIAAVTAAIEPRLQRSI